jgi:hypothetical protein
MHNSLVESGGPLESIFCVDKAKFDELEVVMPQQQILLLFIYGLDSNEVVQWQCSGSSLCA